MISIWIFDALLAVSLPLLAWRVLAARDLFTSIVLFIAFGLLVALAWARLDAPDIALAEAAIGAGLTGVLFLDTLGWINRQAARRRASLRNQQAEGQVQERLDA